MMLQIALTIVIVFILGLAFALTSLKLGRGDKRPGCGHGTCSTCNPANRDATCPSQTDTDSREECDTDTDVHIRLESADTDENNEPSA